MATFQSQNLDQASKSTTNLSLKILPTIQIQNFNQTLLRIWAMLQIQNHDKNSASKALSNFKSLTKLQLETLVVVIQSYQHYSIKISHL